MDINYIKEILAKVKNNDMPIDEASKILGNVSFEDLGFAKIDHHREIRVGYPEVIYGEGKTIGQITKIISCMLAKKSNILVTRTNTKVFSEVQKLYPKAEFNELGRVITIKEQDIKESESYIVIVAGGTSDLPVVEEAYETARIFGNKVEKVVDVGVAGIHRLFPNLELIRGAKVVIVVAGMEGALASVIGGVVDKPVIAVPTSVGYGASFGGLSALLSMLNSCASGVSVVNIDNGFGAGYSASIINRL